MPNEFERHIHRAPRRPPEPQFNGTIVLVLVCAALALALTIYFGAKAPASARADLARIEIINDGDR